MLHKELMIEVQHALRSTGFDELADRVKMQAESEPLTVLPIHTVWGFAKDNATLCSDGYMKKCFMHVEWWMHTYKQRHR